MPFKKQTTGSSIRDTHAHVSASVALTIFTSLTEAVGEIRHHGDVVDISLRGGVQQHRAVDASVVEEVKVCVLHEVALRVPVRQVTQMTGLIPSPLVYKVQSIKRNVHT